MFKNLAFRLNLKLNFDLIDLLNKRFALNFTVR